MPDSASISFVASLLASSIIEAAKAGVGMFRSARQVIPPEEETERRESLSSHAQAALVRVLRDVSEHSAEWVAVMRALEEECDRAPEFLGEVVFAVGPERGAMLRSSAWRDGPDVDPARYDDLVVRVVGAAERAVVATPALSGYVTLKMLQTLHAALLELPTATDVAEIIREVLAERGDLSVTEPPVRFAVPFPRNPRFVGRDDDLLQLHEMLRCDKPVGIVGLTGIGGIGKTQLAVEYAYQHRDDYEGGVFWVNAADDLVEGMAQCAELAGITGERDDLADWGVRQAATRRLYRWLQDHPDSLLVLDNIREPGRIAGPLFSNLVLSTLPCRMIFTTRDAGFDDSRFARCRLDVLPREVSLRLLLADRALAVEKGADEWKAASDVCEMLGNLALAVAQAGAYLQKWPQVSVSDYRDRLAGEGLIVTTADTPLSENELARSHAVSVKVVLRGSVGSFAPRSDALTLLRVLGEFRENEMVPRHRAALAAGLTHEARGGRVDESSSALEELNTVSLVEELTSERLRLHPLVREHARSLTAEDERAEWLDQIARNFATRLTDPAYLERHAAAGIYPLLDDFVAAHEIMPRSGEAAALVRSVHRLLDREAHNLRRWEPQALPAFFCQQVRNRALEIGLQAVQEAATAALAAGGRGHWLRQVARHGVEDPRMLRILSGHARCVNSVAFSPEAGAQLIASGADDCTIRIWDADTGREVTRLEGHKDYVTSVAFSSDGKQVVSGSWDRTVRVWEVEGGRQLARLEGHEGWVRSVAFSGDGKQVVSASDDGTVRVWEVKGSRQSAQIGGHGRLVRSVDFSCDGKQVVSASDDGAVRVWEVERGRQLARLEGHGDTVSSVAFSCDGKQVVSGAWDRTVRVWEVEGGRQLARLEGHQGFVYGVAFSPDGKQVVSGAGDGTTRVWEVRRGRQLARLEGHEDAVNSVAFSSDGRQVVSGSWDHTVRVWEVEKCRQLALMEGHQRSMRSVAFSPDGKQVVSGSMDRTVRVWEVEGGRQLARLGGHRGYVESVAFSPDGKQVVFGTVGSVVQVWKVEGGRQLARLEGHRASVYSVAFSPDGKHVVAGSLDPVVRAWEVEGGRQLAQMEGHERLVRSVAFSPDGKQVVSGSLDRTVRVWEVEGDRQLARLEGHEDAVNSVAFSPDGKHVVSGSLDRTVRVWELDTGREIARYPTRHAVKALWCSARGRTIKAADLGGMTHRPHVYELELMEVARDPAVL